MSLIDTPLENIFADELMRGIGFYNLSRNHVHSTANGSNNYPCIRFDIRDELWSKELPEEKEYDLERIVIERFYEDLDCLGEGIPELEGFDITTDMNGYRMLLIAPIYDLQTEREEQEEELKAEMGCLNPDVDTMNDIADRIKEIDEELVKCAIAYDKFFQLVQGFKGYFDDYVVVVDEEGVYDFVHREWYEDMKEEYGWKLWRKEEWENTAQEVTSA